MFSDNADVKAIHVVKAVTNPSFANDRNSGEISQKTFVTLNKKSVSGCSN